MSYSESSISTTSKIQPFLGARPEDIIITSRPAHLTSAALRETCNLTNFLEMFRSSAPYIRMHRATTMVIHMPGECFDGGTFNNLMDEVALLSMLGARIVLVVGCRPQIDAVLESKGMTTQKIFGGKRITKPETLAVVKQCAGYMRFEVESALARGRTGDALVQTTGGNFFSAQPVGVRNGVDYGFTGEVRRIEVDKIQERLLQGDIVHLTCLGFSPSGQVFNVDTEELARTCAIKLEANKLIYIMKGEDCLWDSKAGHPVLSLQLREAAAFVNLQHEKIAKDMIKMGPKEQSVLDLVGYCVDALQKGVKRAHLVPPVDGGLIEELYTREGAGMLISRDIYEGISAAEPKHLPAISKIISSLASELDWTEVTSENELDSWIVFTKDEKVVGCASLDFCTEETGSRNVASLAELGHLAVLKPYRSQGIGRALIGYIERMALARGVDRIVTFSAVGGQWLIERGFRAANANEPLPLELVMRRSASKQNCPIYVKHLQGARGIDADELLWDIDSIISQAAKRERPS